MAVSEWPAGVPYKSDVEGWQTTLAAPPISTDLEGPSDENRSRPGDGREPIVWQRALTRAQFSALQAFIKDTLRNGAARFWMPVCLDRSTYEVRAVLIEPGSVTATGLDNARVQVAFRAEVLPATWVPSIPTISGSSGTTISGTAPTGAVVEVEIGSTIFSATNTGGSWSVSTSLARGLYDVRARATVAGRVGPWSVPIAIRLT